jgi:hypothetical protein
MHTDMEDLEKNLVTSLGKIEWGVEAQRGSELAELLRRLESAKLAVAEIALRYERLNGGDLSQLAPSPAARGVRPAMSHVVGARSKKTMLDWCAEILRAEARPVHYEELTRRMLAGGYQTRGKTPERSVVTMLIRAPEMFEPVGNGFYQLRRG